MAEVIMTLSPLDRRLVREIKKYGQKLYMARQNSQAVHVLSAALAYLRSLAASALNKVPGDISWKDIAFVMKEVHQDIVMLGNLHTDCALPLCATYHAKHDLAFGGVLGSAMAERAMDIADILLKAQCPCCDKDRSLLACRSLCLLVSGELSAGNLMEGCRAKWAIDRLDFEALPTILTECGISPESRKKMTEAIPDLHKVVDTFVTDLALVEIPPVWRNALEASPKGTCWYPPHISCQDINLSMEATCGFQGAVKSELINCGTYESQPLYVIRHNQGTRGVLGPQYSYSVYTLELTDEGDMLYGHVRQLGARKDKFEVGAVAGDMLYLTSFQSPLYGALLAVSLHEDEEPQWTMLHQDLAVLRVVNTMVGLGGDLYVYGGHKSVKDGELEALSDILVARAKGGVVNQPWKRLRISAFGSWPQRRMSSCVFGHKSPEGRLSLFLFGGMKIMPGTKHDPEAPVKELWSWT